MSTTFPAAGPDTAGDARWPAESEAAQFEHAQAVDLTETSSGRVDQGNVVEDILLGTIAQT